MRPSAGTGRPALMMVGQDIGQRGAADMPRMENAKGEALYYNVVEKNGKIQYVLKGIGSTLILGRDKQKKKSRIFTQEAQVEQYLRRHGFETTY